MACCGLLFRFKFFLLMIMLVKEDLVGTYGFYATLLATNYGMLGRFGTNMIGVLSNLTGANSYC